MTMKRIFNTISKYKLVENGDKIAVALSGGKDSSSLLFILNKIFKNNPNVQIFALSIDEGIKKHRKKSLEKAKELTKKLGIKHYLFSFKKEIGITVDEIAKDVLKKGVSLCSYCAVFRRWLLNKKARELGATKLAVAFNLDDESQTILMNVIKRDILRLARTSPMPEIIRNKKFVPRIKPLMFISENEIRLYAKIRNFPFDESVCPYRKYNTLRVETYNFLNALEEKSPGIKYSLVKSGLKIAEILKGSIREEKIRYCEICGEPSSKKVCKACELKKSLGLL